MVKKILFVLLSVTLLATGCAKASSPAVPLSPEKVVQEFLQASSAGDVATCLGLLADDVLFQQEQMGVKINGKAQLESTLWQLASWQPVKDYRMYGPVRISPHDSNVIFLAHRDGLYKSTDGLMTVKKVLESEDISDIEFSLSDPNIVYAGGKGLRIFKSTDGGDTFTLKADLRKFITEHK